ncbi:Carboxylesterase type B [Penicillium lagena]|uniref:Carboxylesterase type B n=1 Tax=Penicillium lagena TaxID=94218 RepID=UPI002542579C|nr:Carboxylesterase type B [Penicillium lagena]KAJ5618793.1 Carboxylesterase type B [Penicillium lagena]
MASISIWECGGGYANNANGNYNGSEVVERSGLDMIFVNFNYRVGALGFLASENVRKDGDLNAGLLDQRKVLEWVQENIREFGGSKTQVVIHGDSAGAGSVAHHLAAYRGTSSKMFSGAIAESSFWPTQRTIADMEFQYERFVEDVNCHEADDPLACLRAADIQTIQAANVDKPFPGGNTNPAPLWYFLPVVDGCLITSSLYDSFSSGQFVRVPLMVSDDTNEGTDFAYNATDQAEMAQFMKNNYPKLTENQLDQVNKAYPLVDLLPKHAAYFPSASAAYGESTFTCPGNLMAAAMARTFGPDKVWNYRYNVRDPIEIANGMGTPHVFDLPAIFGIGETNEPTLSYPSINKDIINTGMDYYISFVKVQNPNYFKNAKAPEWKPWGSGSGQRMKLQTNSTQMEAVPRSQLDRCKLWLNLAASMEH